MPYVLLYNKHMLGLYLHISSQFAFFSLPFVYSLLQQGKEEAKVVRRLVLSVVPKVPSAFCLHPLHASPHFLPLK